MFFEKEEVCDMLKFLLFIILIYTVIKLVTEFVIDLFFNLFDRH